MSSNFHEVLLPGAWKIGKYLPPGEWTEKRSADVILGGKILKGEEKKRENVREKGRKGKNEERGKKQEERVKKMQNMEEL